MWYRVRRRVNRASPSLGYVSVHLSHVCTLVPAGKRFISFFFPFYPFLSFFFPYLGAGMTHPLRILGAHPLSPFSEGG